MLQYQYLYHRGKLEHYIRSPFMNSQSHYIWHSLFWRSLIFHNVRHQWSVVNWNQNILCATKSCEQIDQLCLKQKINSVLGNQTDMNISFLFLSTKFRLFSNGKSDVVYKNNLAIIMILNLTMRLQITGSVYLKLPLRVCSIFYL